MQRKARIDAPGCLHHIIARDIERRLIFGDDTDRENFLIKGYDYESVVNRVGTLCWDLSPPRGASFAVSAKVPLRHAAWCAFGHTGIWD